jgi:hypothetical protein
MTPLDALKAARDLITNYDHWTTRVFARASDGGMIDPHSEYACQFCAVGAIIHIADRNGLPFQAVRSLLPDNIAATNDFDGHAAVLREYDIAIAKCAP